MTTLVRRIVVTAGSAAVFSPLIQEARERQRRRHLALLQAAALAAVLGLAVAAGGSGGGAALRLGTGAQADATAAPQTDVRNAIARFDGAVAAGDYRGACGLLDPGMGMATVRSATNAVGAKGSCEQRLAAFARVVGPSLLQKLESATVDSVQYGGSEREGYSAAAFVDLHDRDVIAVTRWAPVVGVSKSGPGAKAAITCPPLLCSSSFLPGYSELARSGSSRS